MKSKTPKAFTNLAIFETWLSRFIIAILSLQIVVLAQHTFAWRYGEDVGFFYYFSWLINENEYRPYIDIHETSFPGSFLLYSLITRISGYSVLAYNITHIFIFGTFCTASFFALRKINPRMAIAATCMFGSMYFFMHRSIHMQRDFLVLVFIVFALATMTSRVKLHWRAAVTGVLFGIASTIKPHAAMAAPFIVLFGALTESPNQKKHFFMATSVSLCGFFLVWVVVIGYLVANGSWPYFYSMVSEYLPLYQKMNGMHFAQSDEQRLSNAISWLQGTLLAGIIPTSIGLAFTLLNTSLNRMQKLFAILLCLLWVIYLIYVAMSGKFWDYHQTPANYFYCTLLCFFFIPFVAKSWGSFTCRILYLCITVLFIQNAASPRYVLDAACLTEDPACDAEEQANYAIEDRLEYFLRTEVKPNERVEPLATSTLGPLFPAMLRAGIRPASPYLEGFPLYHDADTQYVQRIRADMLGRLRNQPPRFLIKPVNFFAPRGNAASAFTELDQLIREHYEIVDKNRYPELGDNLPLTIYEKKK